MTPRSDVVIRRSAFGLDSPWRGAAELVFAPVLTDPASVLAFGEPHMAGQAAARGSA
jgi:hypothetical protein